MTEGGTDGGGEGGRDRRTDEGGRDRRKREGGRVGGRGTPMKISTHHRHIGIKTPKTSSKPDKRPDKKLCIKMTGFQPPGATIIYSTHPIM